MARLRSNRSNSHLRLLSKLLRTSHKQRQWTNATTRRVQGNGLNALRVHSSGFDSAQALSLVRCKRDFACVEPHSNRKWWQIVVSLQLSAISRRTHNNKWIRTERRRDLEQPRAKTQRSSPLKQPQNTTNTDKLESSTEDWTDPKEMKKYAGKKTEAEIDKNQKN